MPLNPSIALGVRPLEVPNQLAQYAQVAQIEGAQRQGEVAQMQLEQLKQDRIEMQAFQKHLADSGGNPDLKQFATMLLKSPKYYEKGVEMMQKLREQDKFEETGRKLYPELFGAAPAGAGAMPMAAPAGAMPMAAPVGMPSGALGSGTFGMMPEPVNNLAPAPAAPSNALASLPTTPVAPSNALVAPAGKTPDQLRKEIILFGGSNAPGAKNMVDMLKAQLTESLKQTDTQREMQGLGLPPTTEGFKQYKALSQPLSEFERLLAASDLSPAEKANLRVKRAQKEATHAPGTSVYLPPQEKAFEGELGKGQAEGVIKSRAAAQDAAAIIDTVKTGRDIMKSGMITGAGADFLVNLNQGLKTAGIDAGYADASANSQAFAANMAGNVGKLIKQFGAGTGLSDADREFAKEMAGGRISLDAKAINRILEINEKAARNTITRHNKDVKGIKTNIPLEVEMPPEVKAPVVGAPSAAIEYLRANPAMKGAFDAKYGAGAADRALKGQ
jgi:hypothetical protein